MFNSDERKEIRTGYWLFSGYGIFTVIVVVLLGLGYAYFIQPMMVNADTRAMRNSIQYQTSSDTKLVDKMTQWQDLDSKAALYANNPDVVKGFRSQQATLLRQMREEVNVIGANKAPQSVNEFLASH